jgi:polyhydroxyalkanoate synthesis regulator phasin
MSSSVRKLALLAAVALLGLLAVGVATASAHGGGPGGCKGAGGVSASALVTQAAKELKVTRATLKGAIVDAANAYIDSEVKSGDLTADEAADAKDRVADDLGYAIRVSKTKTVASNLDITVAALNDGFRAARKTLILANIDKAVANGRISADEAAELKEELDDVDLPGYKAFGGGGYGLGYGGGGPGDHRGFHR